MNEDDIRREIESELSGLAHKFGDVLCIRHIELIFFSMD